MIEADSLGQPREEAEQRLVGDLAAQPRVHPGIDRPRVDDALDEPHRRAVGEQLQLGHAECPTSLELAEHRRECEPSRPGEGSERTVDAAIPAVRSGDGRRRLRIRSREGGRGAHPLALRRRPLHGPRGFGERTAPRPAYGVLGLEQRADVVPERARLARRSVVCDGLANEVEPPRRPRARRVEQIPVGGYGIGPHDASTAGALLDLAAGVIAEQRCRGRPPGEGTLFQTEDEDDLVVPRSRPQHVEHGHASGLLRRAAADVSALERVHDLLRIEPTFEVAPGVELLDSAQGRLERTQVQAGRVRYRWAAQPVRGREHRRGELADCFVARRAGAKSIEERQRLAAQLQRLLLDALGRPDRAPAQPSLEEVDVIAAEPGVRRAHEGVEVVTVTAEPGEAKQREQRAAVRRLAQAQPAFDRVGDAEPGERRLERPPPALQRRRDDRDRGRIRPATHELENLVAHELQHAARPGSLEEAHRALHGRRLSGSIREQPALDVGDRTSRKGVRGGRELLDPSRRLARERRGRSLQNGERQPPRLVRQGNGDVCAPRQRFDERPLRGGQVFETVGVDRPPIPRIQLVRHALGCVAPLAIAVPPPQPVELGAVRAE